MKTSQLKKILVPVDFSSCSLAALDQAVFLARLFKADLQLMHVIEIPTTVYSIDNPALPGPDVHELEDIIAKRYDDLAATIRKKYGIRIKTLTTHGRIAQEVVAQVNKSRVDLVVMGTHGISGFDEYFIGSNAHKVVTMCPVPVITVQRKSKKPGYHKILVPIDNSMRSREKMNEVMLLAKKFGSVIHILGLPDDDEPLHLKQFAVKINSVIKLVKRAGLAHTYKQVKSGDLAEHALRYAGRVKADLIVTMTDHESEYGSYIGPFTKQIINHSKIPVLSIKPTEGIFETPDYGAARPF